MTGVPGTVLKSELVVFAEECTVSFTGITGNAHTVTYGDNNNTVTGITAACTDTVTVKKAGETVLTATAKDGSQYNVDLIVEDIALNGEGLTPQTKKNGQVISNKYTLKIKAGESSELAFALAARAYEQL